MKLFDQIDLVSKRLQELRQDLYNPNRNGTEKEILWLIDCNEKMLAALFYHYQGRELKLIKRPVEVIEYEKFKPELITA